MSKKRILLIDDDPGIILTLSSILEKHGYTVIVAKDGAEGLEKALSGRPKLIISDVMMPGMTGYDFVQRLRKQERLRKVPIIVISAKKSMQEFFPAWEIAGFLSKPLMPEELISKVEAVWPEGDEDEDLTDDFSDDIKRVLVVGFEEFYVQLMKELFEKAGFMAFTAMREAEGVSQLPKSLPHLVVCQYHDSVAFMNAQSFYNVMQADQVFKNVPFVLVCQKDMEESAKKIFHEVLIMTYRTGQDLKQTLKEYILQFRSS